MIRVLGTADLAALLNIDDCIETVDTAQQAYSNRAISMPVRLTTKVPGLGDHISMPAAIPASEALGMKCITIFPGNPAKGEPILQGLMVLNDFTTGRPLALIDAIGLTSKRTAAASAVATRALANPKASRLAIIGTGVQARSHLESMCAVRPISDVAVVGRASGSADRFIESQRLLYPHLNFRAAESAADAVRSADIVCAVSSAHEPVILREFVPDGCHINGVGSHGPTVREVDGETMRDARLIVDSRDSAERECGDCILAIAEGLLTADQTQDEIGEVLLNTKPGRTSPDQITVYQSCGLAVQDIAVGRLAYDLAVAQGRGTEVSLD